MFERTGGLKRVHSTKYGLEVQSIYVRNRIQKCLGEERIICNFASLGAFLFLYAAFHKNHKITLSSSLRDPMLPSFPNSEI